MRTFVLVYRIYILCYFVKTKGTYFKVPFAKEELSNTFLYHFTIP